MTDQQPYEANQPYEPKKPYEPSPSYQPPQASDAQPESPAQLAGLRATHGQRSHRRLGHMAGGQRRHQG